MIRVRGFSERSFNIRTVSKSRFAILPVTVALVVGLSACDFLRTREVYLIPAEYVGPIAVVWNHPEGGETVTDQSGATVYDFTGLNVLRLGNERSVRWTKLVDETYYYVAQDGGRQKLLYGGSYPYRGNTTKVEIYNGRIGALGEASPNRIEYYAFCVGVPTPGNACAAFFEEWIRKVVLSKDPGDSGLTGST